MNFIQALKEKVLIFDGAMGTSIHNFDLSIDDYHGYENCPEILVESRPDVISKIHASYLESGCDAIETDTFGGSSIVLAEFGLAERAYELNLKAAKLAREVADGFSQRGHKRFVSGSIGPTTKLPSLGHISLQDLRDAYFPQVAGLVDGGVDVLQFETGQDLLQAKAAVMAMLDYFKKIGRKIPIITQITIEAPPISTMLVGCDISSALTTLSAFPIDVVGINCATGPDEMIDHLHYLAENARQAISVLPNAGLPENINGETVYKLSPQKLAESLKYFATEIGVNIVGGCCGTTPAHLAEVYKTIGGLAPLKRKPNPQPAVSSLYTSCAMQIDPAPIIVGERTNTNGSRKFKQLLDKEDIDGMVAMARAQEKEGAHILDVCTAYVGRDEVRDMTVLIKRLNTEIQIPIMIDSTEFPVLEASLQLITGKPIINSINLEDGVDKMLAKVGLITRYGAAAVALTIDENGMAKEAQHKFEVAKRIHDLAVSAGMKPEDLVFDALTFTLSTGNDDDRRLGLNTLEAISIIKKELPGVKTILGVSNISFGFDAHIRQVLNSVFLHYAIEYGLDMAIVNAAKIIPLYKIKPDEAELHRKLIFDERSKDYDPLFALLDFYKNQDTTAAKAAKTKTPASIEEALKQRIIDGNRVHLEKDLDKALKTYSPLDIINNLLLEGMKVVGELFGAGKMQLPFVLQSAETMKASVKYLEPFMEKKEGTNRGTMVLATVKGDVHDIGKNLVDIILSNNGYRVINLGIKQPIDNIIASAIEHKADCIGMSGLLVKSTVIMKENLDVLNHRDISIPVILGGAALTRRYVEHDCRQVYKGNLFYAQDAFDDLKIMEALSKNDAATLAKMANQKSYSLPTAKPATTDKENSNNSQDPSSRTGSGLGIASPGKVGQTPKITITRSDVARKTAPTEPPFWGSKIVEDVPLQEVFAHINENVLIRGQWQVRQGDTPDSEYEVLLDSKIRPIKKELEERCIREKLLLPKAVYGYFPCQASVNDVIVYDPSIYKASGERKELLRFTFPRQDHGKHLCISDFFTSVDESLVDALPLQIVTMGEKASLYSQDLFKSDKYTDYLYFHGLSVESAEGLAEVMHKRIRQELGFAGEDSAEIKKLLNQGYRGTRYSFGYPACPNLEDHTKLFTLLEPERIGISLSEEFQLIPEQSTSAIIVIHPEAKYFNINSQQATAQDLALQ